MSVIGHAGQTQPEKIDSLLQQLHEEDSVANIKLYDKITELYYEISIKEYQKYNLEFLKLARRAEADSLVARAMLRFGISFHQIGEYEKAIAYYDTALQYYLNLKDTLGEIQTLHSYGGAIYGQHRYSRAYEYYLNGLDLAEAIDSDHWKCSFYEMIARIYFVTHDEENAMLYIRKLLKTANESGNQILKARAYQSVGVFYMKTGRYVEALENLNQALYLFSLNNDKDATINVYVDFGDYYIAMKNYRLALNNFQKALQLCIEINVNRIKGTIYTKIGHTYELLDEKWLALDYNKKALRARMAYGDMGLSSSSMINIGNSYMNLGNYDSAITYLERGLSVAKSIKHAQYLRDAFFKIYKLEESVSNHKKAIEYYKKYIEYRDALQAQERNKEIAELRAKYDIYDKEMELEMQSLKIDRQQNRFLVLVFGAALIVLLTAFIYYLYRNKKKVSDQYLKLNTELEKKFEIRSLELKEKENQFQNLVEQIPMGVYRTTPDGKVEFANNALVRMLGYKSLKEMQVMDLENDINYGRIRNNFKREIAKKGEIKNLESYWVRADGSKIYVSEHARLVKDESGEIRYYEGVVEDITQRKIAEANLKEALEKAKESDRLKSAFLATMQHELRTPLNGILGFSEILKDDEEIPGDAREHIQMINDSGQHLLNIINDILDISTITAGKIKLKEREYNLNTIVDEVVEKVDSKRLQDAEKKNIELKVSKGLSDDKAVIHTDPLRLQQILENLLDNAFKFTYKGSVEISYTLEDNHRILFKIKDTGIGIPKDKIDIIFEQFRQIEDTDTRQYGGSGLGLAICNNLLKLMKGEIRVESKPGQGSVFYVSIPHKTTKMPEPPSISEKDTELYSWSSHSLLIAEDSYSNYLLLKTFLRKTNIRIYYAKNGEEAIRLFKERPDIDLVLMDIQLPGISGYEATEELLKLNKDTRIIAVTAYATEEDKERCLKVGCVDYISKPLRKETLLKKIRKYLNKKT
ncbi:MAG: response regulator [Bacteroidales bacterium]|nr:response regulator [Bacteroidales bacterium]MCF8387270.1 response regulator [Bacteroidales bacterium]MCF8396884.1 response regulator [Bacteroidales bacterium]